MIKINPKSLSNKQGIFIVGAMLSFSSISHANQLEEIVVTAQKRSQNLQDVPIALNVYTEDFIKVSGIQSISALEEFTPGLQTGHQITQPSYTIRGIGTSDFGLGADPAVGVYVDGVYVGRSGAAELPFTDITQVEVLKGPQGTLFGRNTSAGAIQITTTKPSTDSLAGRLRARFDDYDKRLVEGMINTPINDKLALRFNGLVNTRDGDIDNADGADLGDQDDMSLRGSALWNLTDRANLRYTYDYNQLDQDAATQTSINDVSPDGVDPFGKISSDVQPNVESRDLTAHAIAFEYELDFALMEYIGSYREFDTVNRQDEDGFDRSLMSGLYTQIYLDTANREESEQHYHEMRLTNNSDSLQWAFGLSYYKENGSQTSEVNIGTQTAQLILALNGANIPLPSDMLWTESYNNTLTTESIATFGDITWAATQQLNITGGIRFTRDEKDFSWLNVSNNISPMLPDIIFESTANPVKNQTVQVGDSWNNVSPRLVVDYRWTDNMMTFLSLAQGYKAGGYNALQVNSFYDEETVDNIELGIRSEWFERSLVVNASFYQYTYNDRQGTVLDTSGGTSRYLTTTGDAEGSGVDMNINWLAMRDLTIALNYGYLDTEWTNRIVNGVDLEGESLSSPRHQAALLIDYTKSLGENGTFKLHLDHTYTSAVQLDSISAEKIYDITYKTLGESRQNTNARVSWLDNTDAWEMSFWIQNFFDKEYVDEYKNLYPAFFDVGIDLGITRRNRPRSYGVEIIYTF